MLTQTPQRASERRKARAAAGALTAMFRAADLAARTPDADSWPDDFGPYPNRRTRRARPPRHAATGTVTERQNRSDAPAGRTARARRVRAARRATRYARRAGWAA